MKKISLLMLGLAFIALSVFFFFKNPAHPNYVPLGNRVIKVEINDFEVKTEVMDTNAAREKGLSGRRGLADDSGMLFVFKDPGIYGFWMNDMLFNIDIVGLDAEKQVVWLEKNLEPASYPQVFSPKTPVKYVLELPSGFINSHSVDFGQKVSFEL